MKRSCLMKYFWVAMLVVFVAAALALAACGGSGTTASTSPSTAPSLAAASPSPSLSPTMSPIAVPVVKPGEKPPPFAELAKMYAYDASAPLNLRDQEIAQVVGTDTHTARGIVYAGAGREVNAYVFAPKGTGPFPAVLIQSSYPYGEEPAVSTDDAAAMADKGYICLFVDYPSARDLTDYHTGQATQDVREYVRSVIDLRRGIDVLATLPEVDKTRIGFMGEDTAASMGAILAGVDPRLKAYALALTGGYLSTLVAWDARPGGEHYFENNGNPPPKGAALTRYEAQMSVVDPVHYIGHNKGASFLVADMKHQWPAEWRMKEVSDLVAAAPKATTLRWYDNGAGYTGVTLFGVEDDMQTMLDAWMQKTL